MKQFIYILIAASLYVLLYGCAKDDYADISGNGTENGGGENRPAGKPIPEGYFEVIFSADPTRAAVTGPDARIQDLRYLLFTSTGAFVKEKRIVTPANGIQTWPLAAIRDTLPKGSYHAVFIGNSEKTLFPYATSSSPVNYNDVLTGYQSGYSSGRIILPNAEFSDNTEYYMANVTFSDTAPNPYILLQRIISMMNLHRNFVDAQTALNALVNNIVTQIGYKNIIRTQLQAILPGLVRTKLDKGLLGNVVYDVVGGLDAVVNAIVSALIVPDPVTGKAPLVDALYDQLLQKLVDQIGMALTGNTDQAGLLAFLGVLLNPWATSEANAAIVSINNFPKSIDFDLNVQDYFTGINKFKFKFTDGTIYNEKDILVKGFHGLFDIRKINVVKQGILAGVIIDQTVDGPWLLNGTFIDINDPIAYTPAVNRRYKANYSFIDLGLKSYAQQTDGQHSLTLSILLSTLPNLDGILRGIPLLGPILNTTINTLIIQPVGTITVTTSVNLPLLGIENLTLSGGWSVPAAY